MSSTFKLSLTLAFRHTNIMFRSFIYCFKLLIIFFPLLCLGQKDIDSLQSKSYEELHALVRNNRDTDTTYARQILKLYLRKAKKEKDTSQIGNGLELGYYSERSNTRMNYLDSIIKITTKRQHKNYPELAYFYKAQFFLYEKREIEKTINNLNEARRYAKANNNINLLYRIDYQVGIIKSEHLNEKEKALEIFKECEAYYSTEKEYMHKFLYLNTLHVIAETYIGLEKYDSASYYNNLGYNKSSKSTDPNVTAMKAYFTLCEGINKYNRQKYDSTIDSIKKALPTIIDFGDISNTIDSYFYLGKSYNELDDKDTAAIYFKKTDSVLETLSSIPQYKHVKTYEYLKDYYREREDLENQNRYLNKLNTVLENYLNDQLFISKKVKEDYDIPLLKEEQQTLIKKLNKNKSAYISSIWILVALLFLLATLLFYQYRRKRLYRQRFEEVMRNLKTGDILTKNAEVVITKNEDKKAEDIKVPEKHVSYILNKLEEFEKNNGFLELGMSSQSLADSMETNVKYLSRVINFYKNKSFTHYLNELRINYAVKELKENVMLRKFTIKAIANEFGYNSAETFSNAFYKQVKIKPSFFIKELSKNNI